MRDIRPALRSFLLAAPGIAALVSARVYPIVMPQGTKLTSVVYTKISGQSGYVETGPDGLARTRIQIDAWAVKADDAVTLAGLVKDAIDGYRGVMGSGATEVNVGGVFFDNERESYDDIVMMFGASRDFFFWYNEL